MRRRRFWSLAGVAGVLAAVTFLVVPALGQVGDVTGELHLQMDSVNGDRFVVLVSGVQQGEDQLLTTTTPNGCKLSDTADAALVHLTAEGTKNPFPGRKDHRLGVGQNGEGNGEPCGQINTDLSKGLEQVLTLSLGEDLQGEGIDYAEINLGFKFNGDATLETQRNGVSVDTIPVSCNEASDCGPDSGGSDNKLVVLSFDSDVPITGVFDTIVITPGEASAVSLEGDTWFQLVDAFDGEIACGQSTPVLGGGNATFSATRGPDTDGNCKGTDFKLLYNFDSGTDPSTNELFVDFFTEPVDGTAVAQFVEVITWTFASPPAAPPQHRILSYDDPPLDPDDKQPMPWCKKDPRVGEPEINGGLPSGPVDPTDYLPGIHTSCLIEANSSVTLSGTFVTEHIVYNIGDGKRWN